MENVSFSPRPHDFVALYEDEVIVTVKVSKFESIFAYWVLLRDKALPEFSIVVGSCMLKDVASSPALPLPPPAPPAQEMNKLRAKERSTPLKQSLIFYSYIPPFLKYLQSFAYILGTNFIFVYKTGINVEF